MVARPFRESRCFLLLVRIQHSSVAVEATLSQLKGNILDAIPLLIFESLFSLPVQDQNAVQRDSSGVLIPHAATVSGSEDLRDRCMEIFFLHEIDASLTEALFVRSFHIAA